MFHRKERTALKRKPTTLEWFSTAKSYALFSDSNQEYKDVLDYIYQNNIK